LPPIAADGSSAFKSGRTVVVKFRVCDANGQSVGPSEVVATPGAPVLYSKSDGTGGGDASVIPANASTAFRWDSAGQQWIYDQSTRNLVAQVLYTYRIPLLDGTFISYTFRIT
jgi:hypothetical protein